MITSPPMLFEMPRPEAAEPTMMVDGWVLAGSPTEVEVGDGKAAVITGRDDVVGQLVVV